MERQYSYYKPRPARELTCERCGVKFYIKGLGRQAKYCIECKVIIYDERKKKVRDAQKMKRK